MFSGLIERVFACDKREREPRLMPRPSNEAGFCAAGGALDFWATTGTIAIVAAAPAASHVQRCFM